MTALRNTWRPGAGRFPCLAEHRRLLRPLGISLLIHALVLWPAAALSPTAERAARPELLASLRPPTQRPAQPAPLPSLSGKASATNRTATPQPRAEARDPAPASEPVAATASPRPPGAVASPDDTPRESPPPEIDVGGLRQYHLALGRMAGQFRRYPPEARQAGWQGRVVMRLAVSKSGEALGLSLRESSNYPVLDRAALDMMELAARHARVPDSLYGRAFTIDLAVEFTAADDR